MNKSAASHLLPVFARVDLGFERGEGAWLISTNGERYLDFTSGVAVNALGHAHPHLVKALQEQATKLWHMSNLFKSPDRERLAARLCEHTFADFGFFCNSRAAAMECGITPAVMWLAKACGGAFPLGAVLATAAAASGMAPGSHGSTFGGNPLAVAAANAVLDVMLEHSFFVHVRKMSLLLKQKLASVVD